MFRAYFDNNASTPVLPEVLAAMQPALQGELGNASSIHQRGQAAKAAMEKSRLAVAELIGATPGEIVFTSGGTESDNLAIRGAVTGSRGGLPHLITSRVEHHAVLNVFEDLEQAGHPVTWLGVDRGGRVAAEEVRKALRPDTGLISIMAANNETGVVQPIAEIGAIARTARVRFHTDAIQMVGKQTVDVTAMGCDLLSLSGHKLHACSGVGALYVRRGVKLVAQMLGGHHERDRRAGSENLPGIVSLGAAAQLALADPGETERMARLRDQLEAGVLVRVPESFVVGDPEHRVPNTSNICFEGVEGEALVIALDLQGFCVSTGAACTSGAVEPSHVLMAMGLKRSQARQCVRFSLGRQNTAAEVEALLEALPAAVARIRRLNPRSVGRPQVQSA